MTQYLLAAEADRIQDLLFRSSQLREVVGGSQLLSRFCEHEEDKRGEDKGILHLLSNKLGITPDVITSGGGSFRLKFETKEDAHRFGAALAEAYYRATGGTLSVADPVPMTGGYGPASKEAGEKLRQAKRRGVPVATTQIPYIAFCESCGVGLAEAHERRIPEEREAHYLCHSCRVKIAEREEHSQGNFLRQFYEKVKSKAPWPPTPEPEDVARYDPRDYVAYIVADGDGMGRIFESCNQDQAHALSNKMDDVLREALAEPTGQFMDKVAGERASCIPTLPLILGGDDLFALVPARWGLDIAQRLCRTFQDKMTAFVRKEEITLDREQGDDGDLTVTMSAAVVICKANYPYYLAHQIGEERLGATKRAVKALADEGTRLSAVDFEVVLGSQAAPHERTGKWRPTLRPYWVTRGEAPSRWGLSINDLLTWRRQLVGTPARRRSQLREHFDQVSKDGNDGWDEGLQRILKRIERDWTRKEKHPVRRALEALGGLKLEDWYALERKNDEDFWHGHGLPDLLRAWDWTWDLGYPPIAYEGGER
jgi:hypothetical protein